MAIIEELFYEGKARLYGTITGNSSGEHLVLSETAEKKRLISTS